MTKLLHSSDQKLLDAAQNNSTSGLVRLTPEKMESLGKVVRERIDEEPEYYQKICDSLTSEQRLAVTAWVMRKLCDHAREGGTYRYLIYERLGFGPEAYLPLYLAGGMDISNEFDLSEKEEWYLLPGELTPPIPSAHIVRRQDAIKHIQSIDEFKHLTEWEAGQEFCKRYDAKFLTLPKDL